jgi:hypothetical protein
MGEGRGDTCPAALDRTTAGRHPAVPTCGRKGRAGHATLFTRDERADFYRIDRRWRTRSGQPAALAAGENQYVQPDTQGRFWIDLLPEVDHVEWRFYDPVKKVWIDQLQSGRPRLIEFTAFAAGRKSATRVWSLKPLDIFVNPERIYNFREERRIEPAARSLGHHA